jgi:signal peptidase I
VNGGNSGTGSSSVPMSSKEANIRPLERERQVYGNRPVPLPPPFNDRPQMTRTLENEDANLSLESSFNHMLAERGHGNKPIQEQIPLSVPNTGIDVDPRMTEEECLNQFRAMQMDRSNDDITFKPPPKNGSKQLLQPPPSYLSQEEDDDRQHPQQLDEEDLVDEYDYEEEEPVSVPVRKQQHPQPRRSLSKPAHSTVSGDAGSSSSFNSPNAVKPSDFVIDDARIKRNEIVQYMSINGFDRDWVSEPLRFQYTVKTSNGNMHTTFKDIVALQATCLILPLEVMRSSQSTNTAYIQDNPIYQHGYGLAYPYVMLSIEGFDNVYDGTNDNVRRAFCMFVYNKQFQAPHGRGYVIMEPVQNEIKRFEPQPLSTLRNLTISIQRPNGVLLNESRDKINVVKIEYESHNERFLKVVLNDYFDRNEWYRGDTVAFQGVKLEDSSATSGFALSLFETFMNRKEGHEITHVEPTNEDGYRRTFNIQAPGSVDSKVGTFVLNNTMIRALVRHNENASESDTKTTGYVMNISLQNVIKFSVWMKRANIMPMLGLSKTDGIDLYTE